MADKRICSIPDCGKPTNAGGMCSKHYWRWKKYGDAASGETPKNTGIRFIENVALPFSGDDCLRWPISLNKGGYGQFGMGGRSLFAHRYICKAVNGPPPTKRHHAAHNCGNSWCVNPRHIRWATPVDNNADKISHDTHNKGERHGLAKLDAEKVRAIRRMAGIASQSAIARKFGVSQTNVGLILRGERWQHVT